MLKRTTNSFSLEQTTWGKKWILTFISNKCYILETPNVCLWKYNLLLLCCMKPQQCCPLPAAWWGKTAPCWGTPWVFLLSCAGKLVGRQERIGSHSCEKQSNEYIFDATALLSLLHTMLFIACIKSPNDSYFFIEAKERERKKAWLICKGSGG